MPLNSLIPDRRHWPALDDEEDDLSSMAEGNESYEEPEKAREGFASPVDDSEYKKTNGNLDKTNADIIHDLRPRTPLQCNWDVFWR